jgi:small subunit ribosomal protein S6
VLKTYEAMFLVDPLQAATNYNKVREHIHAILGKYGVKIIKEGKWADRTLAYPIRNEKKGTYILVYMEGEAECANKIENDCQLSEVILRVLILEKSKLELEKILNRAKAEAEAKPVKAEDNPAAAAKVTRS